MQKTVKECKANANARKRSREPANVRSRKNEEKEMPEQTGRDIVVSEVREKTEKTEKAEAFGEQRMMHEPEQKIIVIAKIVYGLHALSIILGIVTGASILSSFLFGWPSIAAVVLNYVLRNEAKGTYVESHFTWQIQTFWWAALWTVLVGLIGMLLAWLLIGFAVWSIGFMVMGIWVGYRIIRGWIRLTAREGMPV